MAAGQLAGVDFQFFHGIAIPLIHYPLFVALGGNLFAAETLKFLLSPLAFVLSSYLFLYAYTRRWKLSAISTAALIPVAVIFIDVINPGGSLRGLRGTLPILLAAWLLWDSRSTLQIARLSIPLRHLIGILLICFSFMMSTEHGIAVMVAYVATSSLSLWHEHAPVRRQLLSPLLLIISTVVVLFVGYSIITHGRPQGALQYALAEVPGDQGWYFGSPPNPHLTWDLVGKTFTDMAMLPFWIVIGCGFGVLFWLHKTKQQNKFYAGLFMAVYGTIVFLGGITGYFDAATQLTHLQRAMALLIVGFLAHFAYSFLSQMKLTVRYGCIGVLWVGLLLSGLVYAKQIADIPIAQTLSAANHASSSDDYFALNEQWKERVNAFRPYLISHTSLWSTYVGVYESQNNIIRQPNSGEDYIIHGLGTARRANYTRDFIKQRPEYVTTLVPAYFYYEEWLWTTSPDFYSYLLENYEIIMANDSHYLWRRIEENRPTITSKIAKTTEQTVELPANHTQAPIVYEVTVDYHIKTSSFLADKFERYLLVPTGMQALRYGISLPPKQTQTRMVIPVMPGDEKPMLLGTVSGVAFGSSLTVQNAKYRPLSTTSTGILPFINNQCIIESGSAQRQKCDALIGRNQQ